MSPDGPQYFLNIDRSLSGNAWVDRLDIAAQRQATAIVQQHGITDILARILAARGVDVDQAVSFLTPTIRELMPDPSTMTDMDALATRLAEAISGREKIALFGDYDVDGASSCAMMLRFLRSFGLSVVCHIPDRIFEGYGPNIPAINSLIDDGATLLILLDCGTTSVEAVAHARARDCDVLILDHHLATENLPDANALVNPNRPDDLSELGYLCAAGVTFMALVATNRALRNAGQGQFSDLMSLADLAALATICDVVPLKGLNRALVVRGVQIMKEGKNLGIAALALAARLNGPIGPSHLGFMIGPRINAGGRIGDAGLGTRLLATSSDEEAMFIAAQLDELNSERQTIEAQAVEEAIAVAEAEIGQGEGPAVLVLASQSWHPGVVGLVASRLKDRFGRPAFAIAMRPDGTGSGSGRSLSGVDLGSAVLSAVQNNLIQKGGGHAMAAGISLAQNQISGFRAHMNELLAHKVSAAREKASIKIDAAITARTATPDFVNSLGEVGPFGMGNPSPVFALASHFVTFSKVVGKGGHVQFSLKSGDSATLKGIAFRAANSELGQAVLNAPKDKPFHFCGTLNVDYWQGRARVQMRLIDMADPTKPAW
ncbi:MAG: single-stranded-DNA-specific exonuclease RecJ [Devosiaceae bacterium]|nr:single-stranded-DNA-specific exonuclease RecJ [Devosiaceae bacterium]